MTATYKEKDSLRMLPINETLAATGMWAYPSYIEQVTDSKTGLKRTPRLHFQIWQGSAKPIQVLQFKDEINMRTAALLDDGSYPQTPKPKVTR